MNLNGFIGHHRQHLGSLELGHGHVRIAGLTLVITPTSIQYHQLGCLHLHGHVRQFERDALKFSNRLTKLLSSGSVLK